MEWINGSAPQEADYYYINKGTKARYYWDGTRWLKPVKDHRGAYSGLLKILDKQPNVSCYAIAQ